MYEGGRSRLLLSGAFFLSGGTALACEVVWQKTFATVFGNSTYATSAVVAAFMCGLGFGSWLSGKLADRAGRLLRIYGFVEAGIGVTGFWVPRAIHAAEPIFASAYLQSGTSRLQLTLLRLGLATVVLLLPTTLMGSTFPIVSKLFVRNDREFGSSIGWLYGLNTLGAVGGASLSGFVLIHRVGLHTTLFIACAINCAVGLLLLTADFVAPHLHDTPQSSPTGFRDASSATPRIVWVTIFFSGFTALSYQVLWTRVLQFVVLRGSSVHAFTFIVVTFLLGNSAGSGASALWLARRQASMRALAVVQALLGCSVLAGFALLVLWTLSAGRGAGEGVIVGLIVPPTFLMGFGFPLMMRLATEQWAATGRSIGGAYAVSILGCVTGPLVTGFVAIGAVGTSGTLAALSTINVVLAVALLASDARTSRVRFVAATGFAVTFAVVGWASGGPLLRALFVRTRDPVLFFGEDPVTTVVATGVQPTVRLNVGGMTGVGTLPKYLANDELLADVPLLLHPSPQKIAVIGFGTGRTSALYAGHAGVEEVDLAEVSESVLKAGRTVFAHANHDVLARANVHSIDDDGFNYLKYVPKRFDVISVDAWGPWTAASAALYTRDFWQLCYGKLENHGLLVTWTFARGTDERTLKILLKTFSSVFVHTAVLLTPGERYILLLGTRDPLVVDHERIRTGLLEILRARDALGVAITNEQQFLAYVAATEEQVRMYTRDESLMNTLDRPILELSSSASGRARTPFEGLERLKALRPRFAGSMVTPTVP